MDAATEYLQQLQETLERLELKPIHKVIAALERARHEGRQIFIMGNGGSASTASHFVCDLAKNTRMPGQPLLKVIGLTDNMAIFSAYANDEGYENALASQLANLIQPRDVVIAISTSGNSENVIRAVDLANRAQAVTVGMTGFDGGRLRPLVDLELHVPSSTIEHVEDVHLILEHLICKAIREEEIPAGVSKVEISTLQEIARPRADLGEVRRSRHHTMHRPGQASQAGMVLSFLDQLSQELGQQDDLAKLIQRTLEIALANVEATSGTILALDEAGNVIQASLAYRGEVRGEDPGQLTRMVTKGLAGWVLRNRQAALVESTREDPRWLKRSWDEQEHGSRSAISVPMIVDESIVGILTLVHAKEKEFTTADLALAMAIAVCTSLNWPKSSRYSNAQMSVETVAHERERRGDQC